MKTVSVALLAALVAFSSASPASAADPFKGKETVIHSFDGADGQDPEASLIDVAGTLYGTTFLGGANQSGTVFSLDPDTGAEKVIYSFCGQLNCTDGAFPLANLIEVNGLFYGATAGGGANGAGSVFALDPANGTETVLYSFCSLRNCRDGDAIYAGLIDVKGLLYGTTEGGGVHHRGTIFSIDPKTGTETVMYLFCKHRNCADGQFPAGGVIEVKGTLYGTTSSGGAGNRGTVFALDLHTGKLKVLYSFCSQQPCTDGSEPIGGFIDVNGTLYGTTRRGGANHVGTVFSVDPNTGAENVVYSFCHRRRCGFEYHPNSGLTYAKGRLFGTYLKNNGTIFSVDPNTGVKKMIYTFCRQENCADGQYPTGGLINVKGTLYGVTEIGGAYKLGTVFAVKR